MIPMYEWTPFPAPVEPDRFLCPSLLDLDYYGNRGQARFLPVPVEVPWRKRRRARIFVHNAGNAESAERNGTPELLKAILNVKSNAKFLLRMQHSPEYTKYEELFHDKHGGLLEKVRSHSRVEFINRTIPFEELWSRGDVFVFPEKFNGLSMPLQEAHASGMLVMAGDRYPVNTWLPEAPLIPVHAYEACEMKVKLQSAEYLPEAIAQNIDNWFDADISVFSEEGKAWAEKHTWDIFRDRYRKFILAGG
jgi:hypothetical protein